MAGGFWMGDIAGAALFSLGISTGVAALALGQNVPVSTLVTLVAGGLVRWASVASVHRVAVAEAQRAGIALRTRLFPRLLGGKRTEPIAIGRSATLAIDHVATMEAYRARFVPVRFSAAAGPLLVVVLVAGASLVSAAILFATLIPFVLGMILAGGAARRASERQLDALGTLSGIFVDRVRTVRIIRHFDAEDRVARQVAGATAAVAERTIAVLRAAFLSGAVLEFFSALSVALVAVYCGFSLLGLLPFKVPETLTLREAFFSLAMAPEFYLPMRRLAAAYHEKQLGEAAEKELAPLLADMPASATAEAAFDGLVVRDVSIHWPGHAIGPVDFVLGQTGMVALTGPTGAGKTSLLAAIAGQIDLASGSIRTTGDARIASGDIAWAAQVPLLLPGSLRDNLVLARPDASDADVADAVARVGLGPLVAARPEALALVLDHRGSGLSGGERRRIGLARALLSGRPLLLCDEPTADLDDASADAIAAMLADLAKRRALVVATHDARLVALAEREVAL